MLPEPPALFVPPALPLLPTAASVPSTPSGPPLSDLHLSLLREAAVDAEEAWIRRHGDALGTEAVRDSVALMLRCCEEGLEADHLEALRTPPAMALARRAILDHLRAAYLERVASSAPPLDPAAALAVVQRMEGARAALEPDWDTQVEAGLMGPSASEMLAEVGHDLRSPLTSVLFLSEVLRGAEGIRDDENKVSQLGLIYSAAFTMLQIVSNFVELSRGRALPGTIPESAFSVSELADSVRRTVQPLADDKGLRLEFQYQGLVAERRRGHPVALSRILLNLLTNALKFTDEGTVRFRVHEELGSTPDPAGEPPPLLFEVVDTGPGLEATRGDSMYQVFEPSKDRSGIRFSGSGLGLVIVRRLLQSFGSELEWDSGPTGTRFWFRLALPAAGHDMAASAPAGGR